VIGQIGGSTALMQRAAEGRLSMRGTPTGVAPGGETPEHLPPAGKELAATALPHPPPRAPRPLRGGVRLSAGPGSPKV